MKYKIGLSMFFIPVLGLLIYVTYDMGTIFLKAFGIALLIFAWVGVALYLMGAADD